MTFIIWLLTAAMVLDCVLLILLVLIQLPKKEAGAGIAFGGGATDALFGAGSGNVLTKITKWVAGIFFVLALVLSMLHNRAHHPQSILSTAGVETTAPSAPSTPSTAAPSLPSTNSSLLSTPPAAVPVTAPASATNAPK